VPGTASTGASSPARTSTSITGILGSASRNAFARMAVWISVARRCGSWTASVSRRSSGSSAEFVEATMSHSSIATAARRHRSAQSLNRGRGGLTDQDET
jgi:hypothetical protein